MEKKKLLLIDLTIMEDFCNLQCKYCGHEKFKIDKQNIITYKPHSELHKILNSTMEMVHKNIDAPVLKISGGEIFMIDGILDFIKEQSRNFPLIQILTNATMLNENSLNELQELGNIIFQVSLDGHTFEMNQNRFKTEAQFNRVRKNIQSLLDKGFAVEINTVIHPSNIKSMRSFMDYLAGLDGKIRVFPYPVRWVDNFDIDKEDIKIFREIFNSEKYKKIMPLNQYMEELIECLEKKRTSPCFTPNVILGISESGSIRKCACGISGPNLISESTNFNKVIEPIVPGKGNVFISDLCNTCFTNYEFYNLLLSSDNKTENMEQLFFDIEKPILNRLMELKESR